MPVRRAEIELAAVLASDEAMARLGVPAGHALVNGTPDRLQPGRRRSLPRPYHGTNRHPDLRITRGG
jgi:hypothetical protein